MARTTTAEGDGRSPLGACARRVWYDREGIPYAVEWLGNNPVWAGGTGVPVWGADGVSPVGDVSRTAYFDERGEVVYAEWAAAPPPAWGESAVALAPAA